MKRLFLLLAVGGFFGVLLSQKPQPIGTSTSEKKSAGLTKSDQNDASANNQPSATTKESAEDAVPSVTDQQTPPNEGGSSAETTTKAAGDTELKGEEAVAPERDDSPDNSPDAEETQEGNKPTGSETEATNGASRTQQSDTTEHDGLSDADSGSDSDTDADTDLKGAATGRPTMTQQSTNDLAQNGSKENDLQDESDDPLGNRESTEDRAVDEEPLSLATISDFMDAVRRNRLTKHAVDQFIDGQNGTEVASEVRGYEQELYTIAERVAENSSSRPQAVRSARAGLSVIQKVLGKTPIGYNQERVASLESQLGAKLS